MQSKDNCATQPMSSRQVADTGEAQWELAIPTARSDEAIVNHVSQDQNQKRNLVCPKTTRATNAPDTRARALDAGAPQPEAEILEDHYRIVILVRGHDHAIGVSPDTIPDSAGGRVRGLVPPPPRRDRAPRQRCHEISQLLLTLTRKFSRAEAESLALQDAGDFRISDEVLRRDAKHLRELGSFSALADYHHNNVQKSTGLNLECVNSILGNDPQIEKIRDIVQKGATIDMAPDFTPIHRTAKASDRHQKTGRPTTEMQPAHRSPARVK